MTEDIQFVCGACEKDYEGDISNVITQCRVCNRTAVIVWMNTADV